MQEIFAFSKTNNIYRVHAVAIYRETGRVSKLYRVRDTGYALYLSFV